LTGKKKDTVVCLVGARSSLRPEKKKIQSSVWRVVLLCQCLVLVGNRQFFCCGGKVLLRPEKEKKDTVICLANCAVVSVFGSGDYDRKKKVLVCGDYDQKKKRYSRLSGGLCYVTNLY
jgi:hypothetical protein